MTGSLDAEDAKLVTLARGARARIGAIEGAAVRDDMGRTYSGASVHVGELRLSALQLAAAQAAAAGARGIEAAALVSAAGPSPGDLACIRALGGAQVLVCDPDGTVRASVDS